MNELLTTTEGTWLLKKMPNFSEVSWPDLVSSDQCFSRFANLVWVSKWSEETAGNRDPGSLSLDPHSPPPPNPRTPARTFRYLTGCLSTVVNLDAYRVWVVMWIREWAAFYFPPMWPKQNTSVHSMLITDCQHTTLELGGWLLRHEDTQLYQTDLSPSLLSTIFRIKWSHFRKRLA